jgi:hypothetical protein
MFFIFLKKLWKKSSLNAGIYAGKYAGVHTDV